MRGDYVPFELQIEIMKRLPVKSLMKFRSVSKKWKSTIHSSRFSTDYHTRPHQLSFVGYSYKNDVDIFNNDDNNRFLQRLTLPMSPQHPFGFQFNKMIGYSQGMFAFHCYNTMSPKNVVVVWNPSIRKSVLIPVKHDPHGIIFAFTVVCNDSDPMILKITCSARLVEIFTLSTWSWRTLAKTFPNSLQFSSREVVVIDRFIHWIVYDLVDRLCTNLQSLRILSFDITREQFTELCLPPTLAPHPSHGFLKLSKLKESLVVLENDVSKQEISVWMMMMESGAFTKLYTVKPPYPTGFPIVLGFRNNGQPIIYLKFPLCKEALLFYESDLKCFNEIETSGHSYSSTAGSYMETLLLLNH